MKKLLTFALLVTLSSCVGELFYKEVTITYTDSTQEVISLPHRGDPDGYFSRYYVHEGCIKATEGVHPGICGVRKIEYK